MSALVVSALVAIFAVSPVGSTLVVLPPVAVSVPVSVAAFEILLWAHPLPAPVSRAERPGAAGSHPAGAAAGSVRAVTPFVATPVDQVSPVSAARLQKRHPVEPQRGNPVAMQTRPGGAEGAACARTATRQRRMPAWENQGRGKSATRWKGEPTGAGAQALPACPDGYPPGGFPTETKYRLVIAMDRGEVSGHRMTFPEDA